MENRNETHPLLHSVYEETWRSRARKRCLRMPSQLTLTGVILGVFLVVVTLLIVFENVENETEDGKNVATKLLASPFKFNKKIEDQSWQDKKDFMKKQKDYKYDKVNKGWKKFPDISEMNDQSMAETNQAAMGKYNPASIQKLNEDKMYIKNLLHSGTDWKLFDEGWKSLIDQGWKDSQIRAAIFQALREKRKELMKEEGMLQAPLNLNDIWSDIKDTWDKTIAEGKNQLEYQKNKGEKEMKRQKTLNDEWKDKMNILQSPMSDMKKYIKEDEGWQKLADLGWKNKMIEEALIQAWKERESEEEEKENLMQSPMNIPSLFGKATEIIKNLVQKGVNYPVSQTEMNDAWANEFGNVLEMSYKKWKENGKNKKNKKKKTKKGKDWKNKQSNNTDVENETEQPMETGNENEQPMQSPINFEDLMEIIEIIKEKQKGWTDQDLKDAVNKAWKEGDRLLESAMGSSDMKWKKVNDGYKKISKSGAVPERCPFFSRYFEEEKNTGSIRCALIAEYVSKRFGQCIDMSFLPKECRPSGEPQCSSPDKYRSIDGNCNNRINPTWGNSFMPFRRMIAPAYDDGVSSIRKAKDGSPLPLARILSQKLYAKRLKPYSEKSLIFMYFGLLIDHDLVQTKSNDEGLSCCDAKYITNPESRPTECLQIDIPSNDTFYGPKNVTCLNFQRSFPVIGECGGRREQFNKATSFLDASVVYGSDIEHAKKLRTFKRGQLRTRTIKNFPFMGISQSTGYECGTIDEPLRCFEAGDVRVNMLVELAAMHTLWYREHNRIATELLKLNPQWCDETLYQEARRIVIGEIQHITYNEFLPLLLGDKAVHLYELKIAKNISYNGYDETIDPTVFNNFGAAALRVGHSLAPDVQELKDKHYKIKGIVPLHETFFNLKILYKTGLDLLIIGALLQRTQTVDSYINTEVRDHLFQPEGSDFGFDLAAIGIVRSRDHGLPPYLRWRAFCKLPKVQSWDDLYMYMDKERVYNLRRSYKSVEDIDLIPGALAEHHDEGSFLGPTYNCLIGNQFRKTRKGDRFWFENRNNNGSFTEDQLDEIYNSNMARIICDNSDNITEVQAFPFKVVSDLNPIVDCNSFPKVDLLKWKTKY